MHLLSFTTKNLLIGLNTPHVSIKQENAGMGYNISHIKPFFQWKLARHITYFITKEDSAEPTGLLGNPCY